MRRAYPHVLMLLAVVSGPALAQQASVSPPSSDPAPAAIALDEIVKRAAESEGAIIANLQAFKPIVEVEAKEPAAAK